MTFTQIRYFISVVEKMSISRAAEAMFITQSAMSRQIAQLESELGVKLFDRGIRCIALTEAGKIMYDGFLRMQLELERTMTAATQSSNALIGRIVVAGFSEGNIYSLYSDMLSSFRKKHSGVELVFGSFHLGDLYDRLRVGEADVLITMRESLYSEKGLKIRDICTRNRYLVCSRSHPLSGEKSLSNINFDLFLTEEQRLQPFYQRSLAGMAKANMHPNPVYVANYPTIIQKVKCGEGFMLSDDLGSCTSENELVQFTLDNIHATFCVAHIHETAPILALVDAIAQYGNPFLSC